MKETKFKQTEVGMIPSDWEETYLGNIGPVKMCKRVMKYQTSEKGDIPFYKIGTFGKSPDAYISKDLYHYLKNKYSFPQKGTVLISAAGTIGRTVVYDGKDAFFQDSNIVWLENDESVLTNQYLYYLYQVVEWKTENGGAVSRLYNDNFKITPIAIPSSKKEQQRIANALSDVDTLIESLEKLIAKKKNIKQGAMQQLLTGKKRLPGFAPAKPIYKQTELGKIPTDWEVKTFGDVGKGFSAGATPYRQVDRYYEGDIKWVSSGELDYNVIQETQEHISIEAVKATNLTLHPKNTFLMAITGLEAAGTRGRCAILGCEATTNQSCLAIYESEYLSIPYLYHFYVKYGDALAFAYAQGSKQQSFTAAIVKKLPIVLPSSKAEQTAIANVLSDMDTEISALETKLAKYRTLKTGMMQQLLTGKNRLI